MTFKTKAYTLVSLIKEVKSVSAVHFISKTTLANAISPRAGLSSAKIAALNTFLGKKNALNYYTSSVVPAQAKQELLIALRNRKNA